MPAYHGTYFVQDSIVHVRSPLGAKSTQVGKSSPETIAKLLLRRRAPWGDCLVARFSQIEGYKCLSLTRALDVVKCQLALV